MGSVGRVQRFRCRYYNYRERQDSMDYRLVQRGASRRACGKSAKDESPKFRARQK